MQRKDLTVSDLLSMDPIEREQYIDTLNSTIVEQYIHVANQILISQQQIDISLKPSGFDQATGEEAPPFAHYEGAGKPKARHEVRALNELLRALIYRKTTMEQEWKDQVSKGLYTLIAKDEPGEIKGINKIFFDKEKKANELKNALEQVAVLKQTLALDDRTIYQQKMKIQSLQAEVNELRALKADEIDVQVLKNIVKKYERINYRFFSRTPEVLGNLKSLYQKAVVTKFDIQNCFNDPRHFFRFPAANRSRLTNRERLICELGDEFIRKEFGHYEMKMR